MLKVYAYADEWWPVYDLVAPSEDNEDGPWSYRVDLPNDLVDRYRKARKAFIKARNELEGALDKARPARPR